MVDPYGNPYAMHPYGMGPYAAGPTGAMGPQSMALVPVGECYTGNRYKCCYKHYNVFTKLRGCCVSIPCSFSSCSSPHLFIFVLLLLPILLLLITPLVPPSLPSCLSAGMGMPGGGMAMVPYGMGPFAGPTGALAGPTGVPRGMCF